MMNCSINIISIVFLASVLGTFSLGTLSAAEISSMKKVVQQNEGQSKTQENPYTKENWGSWSAAVANTHSHMIMYEKNGTGVNVTVKIDSHPMDAQKPHYILWIRLEDGLGNILGEKKFTPFDNAPIVTFNLTTVPENLKAFEECNIHGIWMSEVNVKLK